MTGLTAATTITAGGYHTCALLNDHTAKCWAYNAWGQLGIGTYLDTNTPETVPGLT